MRRRFAISRMTLEGPSKFMGLLTKAAIFFQQDAYIACVNIPIYCIHECIYCILVDVYIVCRYILYVYTLKKKKKEFSSPW